MSHPNQDEARLADELEALLAALEAGEEPPTAPALPPEDTALAGALVALAGQTRPDAEFAARLEADLRAAIPARAALPEGGRGSRRPLRLPHLPYRGRTPARRWPTWVAAAGLLLAALLLVPPVQAAARDLIIGVVHILRGEPSTPPAGPTPTPMTSVLDLAGETTLDEARRRTPFPIRLPTYPTDLGPPQHVYLQDLNGSAVVLVWMDPQHHDRVRMSLHELSSGALVDKLAPPVIQETTVHGQRAIWTDGPYIVEVRGGDQVMYVNRRLVSGHVLIWTEGGITYRLETSAPLGEAVRIAESLR